MYKNTEPNWIKLIPKKNIYIFGGGKNGKTVYRKLLSVNGCKVCGVIDNNEKIVAEFRMGNGWISSAYTLLDYMKIKEEDDLIIVSTAYSEISAQLIGVNLYNFIDFFSIDFGSDGEKHYDKNYFEIQIEYAKVDSEIDKRFFQPLIDEKWSIAEFGSGGGLLLQKLKCEQKIGIEINPVASEYAASHGIMTVNSLDDIKNNSLDAVISTHALEHCLTPYEIICGIYKKLKEKGKFICVVPFEPLAFEYEKNHISQHLYTWNQRTLGNLIRAAGFLVRETGIREVAWPNGWENMFDERVREWFEAISVLESNRTGYYSVYVIGEK